MWKHLNGFLIVLARNVTNPLWSKEYFFLLLIHTKILCCCCWQICSVAFSWYDTNPTALTVKTPEKIQNFFFCTFPSVNVDPAAADTNICTDLNPKAYEIFGFYSDWLNRWHFHPWTAWSEAKNENQLRYSQVIFFPCLLSLSQVFLFLFPSFTMRAAWVTVTSLTSSQQGESRMTDLHLKSRMFGNSSLLFSSVI